MRENCYIDEYSGVKEFNYKTKRSPYHKDTTNDANSKHNMNAKQNISNKINKQNKPTNPQAKAHQIKPKPSQIWLNAQPPQPPKTIPLKHTPISLQSN